MSSNADRREASNETTSPQRLQELATVLAIVGEDEDGDIRLQIAAHPNSPLSLLKQLADDRDRDVRTLARQKLEKPQL